MNDRRSSSKAVVADPLAGEDGKPIRDVGVRPPAPVKGERLQPVAASRQLSHDGTDTWDGLIGSGAVVAPPYDPWVLVCTVEESPTLPYLIDTIATNVSGFGVQVLPTFPTRDEKGQPLPEPSDAAAQREALQRFLVACSVPLGLEGVIDRVDRDTETIGWGAVEVLRDGTGTVAAFEHVRGYQVRRGRTLPPILVDVPIVHPGTGDLVKVPRYRRFSTFVQLVDGRAAFFKEFGDPRMIDRSSGLVVPEDKAATFPEDLQATEIAFFAIYSPHTSYGVPRWIGGSAHARLERETADLVVSWFLDAPIGAKLAMVAGGSWKEASLKKAIGQIDQLARGKGNAWTLIALEAEKADGGAFAEETAGAPARIALEDLAYEIPAGLYQGEGNLMDESARRLARLFRLPPVYWGGSDDFSRAAVNGARATAEEQVIRPIRRLRWETRLNHEILPSMGINRWKLALGGASTTDDTEIANAIGAFVEGGGVSPNALIRFWNDLTGQDVDPVSEPWGDRPLSLVLELVKAKADPNKALGELAGAWEEQAAQAQATADAAAQAQADALAGGQDGPPGGGGKKPPPGVTKDQAQAVKAALAFVRELAQKREEATAEASEAWYG